jgi:hypothetical protein
MAETTTDAYQRRRRLLLEVSRVLFPAKGAEDVETFVVAVEALPAGPSMEGPAREPRSPSELLAVANLALGIAEPLLRRAVVGEFDHQLRGTPITSLVELHAAVATALSDGAP